MTPGHVEHRRCQVDPQNLYARRDQCPDMASRPAPHIQDRPAGPSQNLMILDRCGTEPTTPVCRHCPVVIDEVQTVPDQRAGVVGVPSFDAGWPDEACRYLDPTSSYILRKRTRLS